MAKTMIDNPRENRILAALSAEEIGRLADDLELVALPLGQVLYECGDTLGYVYFPTTCIVSLVFITENGSSAELAMTGNDGLVGIPLILGGGTTTHRCVVQSAGNAYRLRVEILRWELAPASGLQYLALRYIQALMTQMAQTVVCNRHHTVDQQLCRWLLLSLDRLPGNHLNMTQELIANMLGVRREAVTEAAGKLQAAGLIQYSRGHIAILDRGGLEARVCECYGTVKKEFDRLFLPMQAPPAVCRKRPEPGNLRQRAETLLERTLAKTPTNPGETTRLLHELQVHQIELELHNEELRRAYDEADALRSRYADIYDFAPVGYFTLDGQGSIVDLNLAGAIPLGIKRSEKARHRFAAAVAPEYLAEFNRFLGTMRDAKTKKICEVSLVPNGQRGEAVVHIEAVSDESGRECRMVVTDITAEKQVEKTLGEREAYLRAVLDNFPFMVWLKDTESRFLAVNLPLARNFGLPSVEALVGKTDFDLTPRDLAEACRAADRSVLESGEQALVEARLGEAGDARWFETYRSPVTIDGKRVGTVGFARDITHRHRLLKELEESERIHRDLITKLPVGVAMVQDGIVRYLNDRAAVLLGWSPEDGVGQSILSFLHEADRPRIMAICERRLRGDAAPDAYEARIIHRSGQMLLCRLHVSAARWEGQVAALTVLEDVGESKQVGPDSRSVRRTHLPDTECAVVATLTGMRLGVRTCPDQAWFSA